MSSLASGPASTALASNVRAIIATTDFGDHTAADASHHSRRLATMTARSPHDAHAPHDGGELSDEEEWGLTQANLAMHERRTQPSDEEIRGGFETGRSKPIFAASPAVLLLIVGLVCTIAWLWYSPATAAAATTGVSAVTAAAAASPSSPRAAETRAISLPPPPACTDKVTPLPVGTNLASVLRSPAPIGQKRYDFATTNLNRGFKDFFTFRPWIGDHTNDTRLEVNLFGVGAKLMTVAHMASCEDIWRDIATNPAHDHLPDEYWFSVFEDDVNIAPANSTDANDENYDYSEMLHEFMKDQRVIDQGVFYYGMCAPTYTDAPTITSASWLVSRRAHGFCLHGIGLTKRRARTLFFELAVHGYASILPADQSMKRYGEAHKGVYVFGNNAVSPQDAGHQGLVYQDRKAVPSLFNGY